MTPMDPELRRTWLFGPGADAAAHKAMLASPADALIADLEDFTPRQRRPQARESISALLASWRAAGKLAVVRINDLATDGLLDLQAAMPGRPHVVAYPMAASAAQMKAFDKAITGMENTLGIAMGSGWKSPPIAMHYAPRSELSDWALDIPSAIARGLFFKPFFRKT